MLPPRPRIDLLDQAIKVCNSFQNECASSA
jgi:hypothetical protein